MKVILGYYKRGVSEYLLKDYRRTALSDEVGRRTMPDQVRIYIYFRFLTDFLNNLMAMSRSDRFSIPLTKQ